MSIHSQPSLSPTPFPGILHATLAGSDHGLKQLSVWRQSMAPGGCTPPHTHPCEEVVLCEGGRGEVRIGDAVHAFASGQAMVLPAQVPHQIFNTGDEPLVTLAVIAQTPVHTALPDGKPLELPWRS